MIRRALLLTYHAVGEGRPPLFFPERLFRAHVDALERIGARTLTVSELADRIRDGDVPERAVAITFDDGEVGAVRFAIPLLLERGMKATVFCVAGHLGGSSDWPTYPGHAPRLELAAASNLAALAQAGVEIGCHGYAHEPLGGIPFELARREIVESRPRLMEAVGVTVRTFAWPYGARPNAVAARLIEQSYESACSTVTRRTGANTELYALPRVDAHYLRKPLVLERVAGNGWDTYLSVRRLLSRVRRAVSSDYVPAADRGGPGATLD